MYNLDEKKIIEMYDAGLRPCDIVDKIKIPGVHRIHPGTIRSRIKKSGHPLKGFGGDNHREHTKSDEYYSRIIKVKNYKGLKVCDICDKAGLTRKQFYYALKHNPFEYTKKNNKPKDFSYLFEKYGVSNAGDLAKKIYYETKNTYRTAGIMGISQFYAWRLVRKGH